MSKQFCEIVTVGSRVKLEFRKDACLHVLVNGEDLAKFDAEVLHDMVFTFFQDSNCTRPGFRRRKAMQIECNNLFAKAHQD